MVIRSVASGWSSGWQHSHRCQRPSITLTTGSLTARWPRSPASTVRAEFGGEVRRSICVDGVDPPVVTVRCCATHIDSPGTIGKSNERGPFQGVAFELLALEDGDRLEGDAVVRAGDDVGVAPAGTARTSEPVGEPVGPVLGEDCARTARPVARPLPRGGHNELSVVRRRNRKSVGGVSHSFEHPHSWQSTTARRTPDSQLYRRVCRPRRTATEQKGVLSNPTKAPGLRLHRSSAKGNPCVTGPPTSQPASMRAASHGAMRPRASPRRRPHGDGNGSPRCRPIRSQDQWPQSRGKPVVKGMGDSLGSVVDEHVSGNVCGGGNLSADRTWTPSRYSWKTPFGDNMRA